jgi:hypothetical protein
MFELRKRFPYPAKSDLAVPSSGSTLVSDRSDSSPAAPLQSAVNRRTDPGLLSMKSDFTKIPRTIIIPNEFTMVTEKIRLSVGRNPLATPGHVTLTPPGAETPAPPKKFSGSSSLIIDQYTTRSRGGYELTYNTPPRNPKSPDKLIHQNWPLRWCINGGEIFRSITDPTEKEDSEVAGRLAVIAAVLAVALTQVDYRCAVIDSRYSRSTEGDTDIIESFLVLAAFWPFVRRETGLRPLIRVIDESFSQAGVDNVTADGDPNCPTKSPKNLTVARGSVIVRGALTLQTEPKPTELRVVFELDPSSDLGGKLQGFTANTTARLLKPE